MEMYVRNLIYMARERIHWTKRFSVGGSLLPLLLCALLVLAGCEAGQSESKATPGVPSTFLEARKVTETPETLPNYLGYVLPEPGSTLSLEAFQTAAGPSSEGEYSGPGICLSMLEPFSLMSVGDFPTLEQFLDRIKFKIDGQPIKEYRSLRSSNLSGIENRDADSGELLWRTPDGMPFHIYYEMDLGVGMHTATISVVKPGNEAEVYTWSFKIRE